jgi:cell division septation protein DedD
VLYDIQYSEDKSQAIFIPDVTGHFTLQVTVWKYSDKLGAFVYNFDITETTPEITAQQQSRDDWLNETVEGSTTISDVESTVQGQEADEDVSEPSSPVSTPDEIVTEEKPMATVTQPTTSTEANFTVQIAAESKTEVAIQIVNELTEAGYDAYYQEHTTASNQFLYRIRIGKFTTREEALQKAAEIENDQGFSTWVTSYQK